MKCDKCGSELEGVYVGPGDEVFSRSLEERRGTVIGFNSSSHSIVVYWHTPATGGWRLYDGYDHQALRSTDGRPVLGFRDPRDERIKELEAEVERMGRAATGKRIVFPSFGPEPDAVFVKLDDEAIKNIHEQAVTIWRKGGSWSSAYGQTLRDFRDGRL